MRIIDDSAEGMGYALDGRLGDRSPGQLDLIGTTDGKNAILRLEFAIEQHERKAVQLLIATPTFRELAETLIRFAGKLEAVVATEAPKGPPN